MTQTIEIIRFTT